MAKCEPKFKSGDLAMHKLGFKCVVSKAYTEAKQEGQDVVVELEVPVYSIHYLAANGGVIESQVREDSLTEYVVS